MVAPYQGSRAIRVEPPGNAELPDDAKQRGKTGGNRGETGPPMGRKHVSPIANRHARPTGHEEHRGR